MKKWVSLGILVVCLAIFPRMGFAEVLWDGSKLAEGQIGRITVLQKTSLWEREGSELVLVRSLKPGEKFRVYGFRQAGELYGVGGTYAIKKEKGKILYETPSRKLLTKLEEVRKPVESDILVNQIVKVPTAFEKNPDVLKIKGRIAHFPISILGKLKNDNVQVLLTDKPITSLPEFSYLKNQVPRGWEQTGKTWNDVPGIGGSHVVGIRIGYSDYGHGHGAINLELHEISHSIDLIVYNQLSASDAFKELWKLEAKKVFGDKVYYTNYPEEYFAETFAMYYYTAQSKRELQKKAPLTYRFYSQLQ
ncbi:hypothetical protein RCG23_14495 [Neobacillus sp. PS3-34]|uniref:anthrax toxin lethal factor-related metalloendopeptidase n=1 Tax=Neobacillus sp. PS3-34 TaxID=3070678 RepID=UPI0027DFC16C|nr:hypothetical protein [Neobacillus sp. PS3-34]WML46846.1 hypothetical protein RCG23_14495 [Neobacillus sp. PS3-34]